MNVCIQHHPPVSWEKTVKALLVVVQAVKMWLGMKLMWVGFEAVHFMDLSERFSTILRDVHPVKTVRICPWKQLQESVCRAVCVDTCSDAQMWPDSQSAGVSVELDFTLSFSVSWVFSFSPCAVKEAVLFHWLPPLKWVFIRTAPLTLMQLLISGVTADIHYLLDGFFCVCFLLLAQRHQHAKFTLYYAILEGFCYQGSIPASPFKTQFYPSPLHPSFSGRCVIWGLPCRGFWVTGSTLFNLSLSYSFIKGHEGLQLTQVALSEGVFFQIDVVKAIPWEVLKVFFIFKIFCYNQSTQRKNPKTLISLSNMTKKHQILKIEKPKPVNGLSVF